MTDKKTRSVQITVEFGPVKESEDDAQTRAEAAIAKIKELFPKADIHKSIWEY